MHMRLCVTPVNVSAAECVSGVVLPVAGPGDATRLCGASSCGA